MGGHCQRCGYDLLGLELYPVCPECGLQQTPIPFHGRSEGAALCRAVMCGLIPVIIVLAAVPLSSGWTQIGLGTFGALFGSLAGAGVSVWVYQSKLTEYAIRRAQIGTGTCCFLSFCVNLFSSAAALAVLHRFF